MIRLEYEPSGHELRRFMTWYRSRIAAVSTNFSWHFPSLMDSKKRSLSDYAKAHLAEATIALVLHLFRILVLVSSDIASLSYFGHARFCLYSRACTLLSGVLYVAQMFY